MFADDFGVRVEHFTGQHVLNGAWRVPFNLQVGVIDAAGSLHVCLESHGVPLQRVLLRERRLRIQRDCWGHPCIGLMTK